MASQGSIDFAAQNPSRVSTVEEESEQNAQGLGISGRPISINRVPVGSRASFSPPTPSKPQFTPSLSSNASPILPQTPGSSRALLSPRSDRDDSGRFTYDGGGLGIMREEDDISRGKAVTIDEHELRDGGEHISMNNDNDDDHTRTYPLHVSMRNADLP